MDNKRKISLWLGGLCLFLTFAISVQIRTIDSKIAVNDPTYTDDSLRDEVLKVKEDYESKYKNLEKLQLELENKRAEVTQNDETSAQREEELKKSEAILGMADVTGKGIEITLNDNQTPSLGTIGAVEDVNRQIVHVGDIQNVVNELRNAGAEAISVNDQRILASSQFYCNGNVIRINKERVAAPFVIRAIGNQDELYYALKRRGGYLEGLKTDGIEVKLEKPTTNLTIVKYSGLLKPKYMKEPK